MTSGLSTGTHDLSSLAPLGREALTELLCSLSNWRAATEGVCLEVEKTKLKKIKDSPTGTRFVSAERVRKGLEEITSTKAASPLLKLGWRCPHPELSFEHRIG
jgi:hypothetical protein